MKLYYAPGACSLATHIALREAALPFELEPVAEGRTASGEDFRTVSPGGKVAALKLADGQVLTESAALLQYIADLRPQAGLAPTDVLQKARLREWLNFLASELHTAFGPLFSVAATGPEREAARARAAGLLARIEARLADGRVWLLGGDYSVADAHLFALSGWAEPSGIDTAPWPNLRLWRTRMAGRPAVRAALDAEGLS